MLSEKDLIDLIDKVSADGNIAGLLENRVPLTEQDPNNGTAWVKEGQFFVRDPEGGSNPATITPGPGVQLHINGVLISSKAPVSSTDRVEIKLLNQIIDTKPKLTLAKDKMEARLIFEPARHVSYKLIDQEPQQNLFLKTMACVKLESPFNLDTFKKMLFAENVVTGIDFPKVTRLIFNPEPANVIVARGVQPEPPVDERVEILFPLESKITPFESGTGKVDFFNINNIFSVEEGTLLAYKQLGTPGKPGKNLCGEEVLPPPPRKIELRADKGTILSEDGHKVFAQKTGRPVLRRAGQIYLIHVEDVLIHKGDVDITSGNIQFKGSLVVVHGNVHESMKVQTTGLIVINGSVSWAKVVAYDNIQIKGNTINSTVSAGISKEILQNMLAQIISLEKSFIKIIEIINILTAQERVQNIELSYGYLLKLIIETKVKEVPKIMSKFQELHKTSFVDLPDDMEKAINKLKVVLDDPHKVSHKEELLELLKDIQLIKNYFIGRKEQRAEIQMAGAASCRLAATGNVIIGDIGCFNTTIHAGGNVRINGVFRGGHLRASGTVLIEEAGAEMGAKTLIEAGKNGMVRIRDCNEGVIIRVGEKRASIIRKVSNLVAKQDENNNLQIKTYSFDH